MAFVFPVSEETKRKEEMRAEAVAEVAAIMESREGKLLSHDELDQFRGNSWFWEELLKVMDDDALARRAEYFLSQTHCRRPLTSADVAIVYDDALLYRIIPEMTRRLKKG